MKPKRPTVRTTVKRILTGVVAILALLTAAFAGVARSGEEPLPAYSDSGSYDLSWWSVDGGGETLSSGGSYTLGATIGSPDAGVLAGGGYTVGGGFWGGGEVAKEEYALYLPLVLR
jgi:hypothetical protein